MGATVLVTVRSFERRGYVKVPMEPIWEALSESAVTMSTFSRAVRSLIDAGLVELEDECFMLTDKGRQYAEETDGGRIDRGQQPGSEADDGGPTDPPVERAGGGVSADRNQPAADAASDPGGALLPEGARESSGRPKALTIQDVATAALVDVLMGGRYRSIATARLLEFMEERWSTNGRPDAVAKDRARQTLRYLVREGLIAGFPGHLHRLTEKGLRAARWMASTQACRP